MTLSQRAVEAAAEALSRTFCDHWFGPSGLATNHKMTRDFVNGSYEWKAEARAALTAALTVDGLCLVEAAQWPPFEVGSRVTHAGRQESGTVTAIEGGCVVVEFDQPAPSGKKSIGRFDAAWFRMLPKGLIAAANDGEERR